MTENKAETNGATAAPRGAGLKRFRRIALLLGPLAALLVGAYFYLVGDRFVATENAYVKTDKVILGLRVSGMIQDVLVAENQRVAAGVPLVRLDESEFRIALEKSEAELLRAASVIEGIKAQARSKQAKLALAETDADYAERELRRQEALARRKVASVAQLDAARHAHKAAIMEVRVIEQEYKEIIASLGGDPDIPVEHQPAYLAAKAARDEAAINLDHATLRAPFGGIVSNLPEPGRFLAAGTAALSLVADGRPWIEANFKETQLTHILPGQSVTVTVDTYPGQRWSGVVESIGGATTAEFSVLPAQNATGNWVKVVQRIPVRIRIEERAGAPILRSGMSAVIDVDTGYHNSLARRLAGMSSWVSDTRASPAQ